MADPKKNGSKTPLPATANEFVEHQLDERLRAVEDLLGCHAMSFYGPLYQGVDDILRTRIENNCKRAPASKKLAILLTTSGGHLEPVLRMVDTIRRHYEVVDFVIPNYAYSAGTVFAMSGDAIHMDYYSRLGPIDPQVESSSGMSISALGHLEKFNALMAKAQAGKISAAEVQLMIQGFDQGELYYYEQARDLSIAAIEEWLVKYKFKNWTKTQTRQRPVTLAMKKQRAKWIGEQLNDTEKWHSHGYGISMEVLRRDLNLLVEDFGANEKSSTTIRAYHDLLSDYIARRKTRGVLHTPGEYRAYMQ